MRNAVELVCARIVEACVDRGGWTVVQFQYAPVGGLLTTCGCGPIAVGWVAIFRFEGTATDAGQTLYGKGATQLAAARALEKAVGEYFAENRRRVFQLIHGGA